MANRNLSPKHGAHGRSLALEPAPHLERCREAAGLFFRPRRTTRGDDPPFVGSPASASWLQPGRRKRLVAAHRRRREIVLEEQSVSYESLHRRRRLVAPAVGDNRSG